MHIGHIWAYPYIPYHFRLTYTNVTKRTNVIDVYIPGQSLSFTQLLMKYDISPYIGHYGHTLQIGHIHIFHTYHTICIHTRTIITNGTYGIEYDRSIHTRTNHTIQTNANKSDISPHTITNVTKRN